MSSKTFASRFMLVENRKSSHLGILDEIPQEGAELRQFRVVWEIQRGLDEPQLPREFGPAELLAAVKPANANADRFFVGLLKSGWWGENESESEEVA